MNRGGWFEEPVSLNEDNFRDVDGRIMERSPNPNIGVEGSARHMGDRK